MSFFGFDSTLPRDRGHNTSAPGFAQAADPFAGLSRPDNDDDDALDFEDTYDGLGDQLQETGDDLNDDTFGGDGGLASTGNQQPVGKDFDFFGQTAKVADSITEEQLRFNRGQPAVQRAPQVSSGYSSQPYQPVDLQSTSTQHASNLPKPSRSGYERYNQPGYVPDLQADASIWGVAPKKSPTKVDSTNQPTVAPTTTGKKMMSLEEVEAAMLAQSKKPVQIQQQPTPPAQASAKSQPQVQSYHDPSPQYQSQQQYSMPSRAHDYNQPAVDEAAANLQPQPPIQILQRPHPPSQPAAQRSSPAHMHHQAQQQATQLPQQYPQQHHAQQPMHILQNPNRISGPPHGPSHGPPAHRIITHPNQMASLSEEEKAAYMAEEAKRARRNHKIFLLSKDNGLMTPQDKNFITRIQLQQLVTATGNPNEHGTDAALSEDFYYQVHNQIRGGPRQHPGQPLSNFAQTYLFQTGGRSGNMRRQARGGDNHMQRMEQQVQRAVEAAKNKPKNKQLVIEGSLGKISFSNSKTPKPLLNIKRTESGTDDRTHEKKHKVQQSGVSRDDRKVILSSIEAVYSTLMKMEDHDRLVPPPQTDDINPELAGKHQDWLARANQLNERLWKELKVHEPIGATPVHPFVAFLSFQKGVKAIPRVFRHLTQEQRTTVLTLVIVQLDKMMVTRDAQLLSGDVPNATAMIDFVMRFLENVMPALLATLEDLPMNMNTGLFQLLLERNDIGIITHSRIGCSFLTMMISRIEIAKTNGEVSDTDWEQWLPEYQRFMPLVEPHLHNLFPGSVARGEDIYVWNFLAAISVGASPEQQQRIVYTVRDRVMGTVEFAKTLPADIAAKRLSVLNLFMQSIGLDVELLQ